MTMTTRRFIGPIIGPETGEHAFLLNSFAEPQLRRLNVHELPVIGTDTPILFRMTVRPDKAAHPLVAALDELCELRAVAEQAGVSAAALARADALVCQAEDALAACFCANCLTELYGARDRARGRCDRSSEYGGACGVRAARAVWREATWLPDAPQRRVIVLRRARTVAPPPA
jgi:hypothetical protein